MNPNKGLLFSRVSFGAVSQIQSQADWVSRQQKRQAPSNCRCLTILANSSEDHAEDSSLVVDPGCDNCAWLNSIYSLSHPFSSLMSLFLSCYLFMVVSNHNGACWWVNWVNLWPRCTLWEQVPMRSWSWGLFFWCYARAHPAGPDRPDPAQLSAIISLHFKWIFVAKQWNTNFTRLHAVILRQTGTCSFSDQD